MTGTVKVTWPLPFVMPKSAMPGEIPVGAPVTSTRAFVSATPLFFTVTTRFFCSELV